MWVELIQLKISFAGRYQIKSTNRFSSWFLATEIKLPFLKKIYFCTDNGSSHPWSYGQWSEPNLLSGMFPKYRDFWNCPSERKKHLVKCLMWPTFTFLDKTPQDQFSPLSVAKSEVISCYLKLLNKRSRWMTCCAKRVTVFIHVPPLNNSQCGFLYNEASFPPNRTVIVTFTWTVPLRYSRSVPKEGENMRINVQREHSLL